MRIGKPHGRSLMLLTLTFICCVIALLTWGAAKYTQQASDAATKAAGDLEELRQKYARVKSVHLRATAKISIYQDQIREGTGSFEYWAEGNRYRISCRTDPQLEMLSDIDMAHDGGRFYYFDRQTGILSYRKLDEEKTFSALPNPFFLPVDFLSNDSDECAFCKLRLKDFHSPSTRWDKQKEKISIRSQGKEQATQLDVTELEIPGDVIDKKASKFRMRLNAKANGIGELTKIERMQLDNKPLTSLVFSDFTSTAAGDFPRSIKIQVFDDQSTIIMQVEYTVQTIEIDQPLDHSVFTIKADEAEGVWDSDEKKLIKEKPLKKKPQS